METYPNSRHIPYAPTETADLYPESDGKPMAETDMHAVAIIEAPGRTAAEVSRLREELDHLKARLSDD